MKREIEAKIIKWLKESNQALLISGARQVGKTYTIRKVLNEQKINFCEINFILNPTLKEIISKTNDVKEIISIFRRNSAKPLKEKESVNF